MKPINNWKLLGVEGNRVDVQCDDRHVLHFFVLESNVIRVLLKKNDTLQLENSWCVSPNDSETGWEGRDRMSTEGFTCPEFNVSEQDDQLSIASASLRVTLSKPLKLTWEYVDASGEWQYLAADRQSGAYMLGVQSNDIHHYMARDLSEKYYGLGEKTGDLNRHGSRYQMRNIDAMGYDAKNTDPLYKHIPFYITKTEQASFGIFYDNLSTSWFDLGNELDNYHGYYRSYHADEGDLDFYFMYGEKVVDVTKTYVNLTGRTIFGPKWSLGYSGSTMLYTDAENAQEQLGDFIKHCDNHSMPCDSFQLSSGYTSIGNKRYVFNWNTSKVPNPLKLSEDFHQAGLKLAANIKPCLLQDHPRFDEVASENLFIQDSEFDSPESSQFWDDSGSHLDFTNPKTIQWWKTNVTEQLLEKGIDSTWNDNNEYEVWDSNARCVGFGKQTPIKLIRPLQPLLMMRASFEAQTEFAPTLRPYLISRSGCPGMQRYVQTWSGDNRTNWQTLRYNTRMGVGMNLSGLYNMGHDVGGFSGDRPDPELFVRWVQNGVMHPRFTIHSWNDDKTVNEPWMYPEVTPIIREAMTLRYRLMPYLYDLLWQAHKHHEPMLRATFLDHEDDARTYEESDDFMLGKDLLVASVVEQGQRTRPVYLPDNGEGWYDFHRKTWYAGGQNITLSAALEEIPLLARAGSVIPTSRRIAHVDAEKDTQRQFLVFPFKGAGQRDLSVFDDDGLSTGYLDGKYLQLNMTLKSDLERIDLTVSREGEWQPAYNEVRFALPENELRPFYVNGKRVDASQAVALSEMA
ncbi:glycoside hydrolase family 31 protein [Marinomonas rhizomae]|uniref:glycoside hydrolase family 31 protein n=1 Tax=Marinomonas rhizomae TaxID=491948 RepID=UPI0021040C55|nr:glycoside hydrolase family 31 protein [Marinomonas rhizomae]UTW00965.1 glycoside hydrolase family 31 protein [Marinomonas rhizomae]